MHLVHPSTDPAEDGDPTFIVSGQGCLVRDRERREQVDFIVAVLDRCLPTELNGKGSP